MILNNVTLLIDDKLVKRDVYFEEKIHYIKKELSKDVDCTGLFLLPGLRNSHTHLGSMSMKGAGLGMSKYEYFDALGFKSHQKRTREDVYKASLHACIESLKNGVTNIDTMDVDPEPVIKALEKTGQDYTACLAIKDSHLEAKNVEEQFNRTLGLKGNVVLGLANEYECTPQLLRRGLEFARENDLPIHMHACETRDEVRHMKKITGKRTIEYLHDIGMLDHDVRLAHCTYADSKDILYLAEHAVPVMNCPTSNKAIADNEAPIKDMLRNKVPLIIGNDHFAWNPNTSILKEAWNSHELTDISVEKTYAMTHKPLEEGKEASFSLVNMNELKPYRTTSEFLAKMMNVNTIQSVYLRGKKVVENNKNLLGINEGTLRKDVEKIKRKLLNV